MDRLDLAGIRAQLRAEGSERRAPPRGPLRALTALLRSSQPRPLLGDPPSYEARSSRVARSPPPPFHPDTEQPLELEFRRSAFGQRCDAGGAPAFAARPAPSERETVVIDIADVGLAMRRRRSSLDPRAEGHHQPPFMPEDLADPQDGRAERIYADAGVLELSESQEKPESLPTAGQSLLLQLEQRLVQERMSFIRALAGG